jgi:predicted nucleic acid-binding protein
VLDANVILRFLLADHPVQSPHCKAFFARLEAGQETVYLPDIVVADVVWTLTSFYRWPREQTRRFLTHVLSLRTVRTADRRRLVQALIVFAEQNIDFSDALVAAEMQAAGYQEIYSYDGDFDRVAGLTRIEPA